jgi:hypothetical protein
MPHFWQEFPKAFRVDSVGLKVELFPGSTQDLHELQGGEQKTTTMYLDFSVTPAGLSWARSPLVAAPSPETCRCSLVFNDLPPITGASSSSDLVDHFSSAQALLDKREVTVGATSEMSTLITKPSTIRVMCPLSHITTISMTLLVARTESTCLAVI